MKEPLEEMEVVDASLESDGSMEEFDDYTDFQMLVEADVADICKTYVKFGSLNIKSLLKFESKPILSLTEEECDFIENCKDDDLTRLLVLNRVHSSQIRELIKQLQYILVQCNKCIAKGKESVEEFKMTHQIIPRNIMKTDIWKTAAPYFKDSQFYSPPSNADVAKKHINGELCLLDVNAGRRWTDYDKRALLRNIKSQYYNYRQNELRKTKTIKKGQIQNGKGDAKELQLEVDRLNKEIVELERVFPPPNIVRGIDWINISCVALKGRHTVIECIGFWNMILHPSLNTNPWSSEEDERLQQIVKKCNNQDWEKIAEELGTNRSSYGTAKQYLSNFASKFNKDRFTAEEDAYIIEVVNNVRLGSYIPWQKVAYYFENRSKYQLYHRYRYYLAYNNIKKGQFSEAEDAMIIYLVEQFGKCFNKIAKYFPDRTPIQLRNRYGNYLNKTVIHVGNYTCEEDAKILEHVEKYGTKNWSKTATILQRTSAHVRQRYKTLKKWMTAKPNLGLTGMPRRNRQSLVKMYSTRSKHISDILDEMRSTGVIPKLETVEQISDLKKRTARPPKKNYKVACNKIDTEIVDFLKGTCKFHREIMTFKEDMLKISARRIIQLMGILNEDVQCLLHADEDDDYLNPRLSITLTYIRNLLETESTEIPTAQHTPSTPSTSKDLYNETQDIKDVLPPTIITLLGFRGLIIKINMYKDKYKMGNNSKTISNVIPWKLEHSLLKSESKSSILIRERNLFFKRLYCAFKWPIILSFQYPKLKYSDRSLKPNENDTLPMDCEISTNIKSITKTYMPSTKEKICREVKTCDAKDSTELKNNPQSTEVTFKINVSDKNPQFKIRQRGKQRKIVLAKVIRMNKARLDSKINAIHSCNTNNDSNFRSKLDTGYSSKVINVSDIKLPNANITTIDKKTFEMLIARNNTARKILVLKSEPKVFDTALSSVNTLSVNKITEVSSTEETKANTNLEKLESPDKSQVSLKVVPFLPSLIEESNSYECSEDVSNAFQHCNFHNYHLQEEMSFDDDFQHLEIYNELEVSSEIDSQVMEDIKAVDIITQYHSSEDISVRELYNNICSSVLSK